MLKVFIYTLSSWIILFTIMSKNQYLDLMFIIINTYVHINIGAKRFRLQGTLFHRIVYRCKYLLYSQCRTQWG